MFQAHLTAARCFSWQVRCTPGWPIQFSEVHGVSVLGRFSFASFTFDLRLWSVSRTMKPLWFTEHQTWLCLFANMKITFTLTPHLYLSQYKYPYSAFCYEDYHCNMMHTKWKLTFNDSVWYLAIFGIIRSKGHVIHMNVLLPVHSYRYWKKSCCQLLTCLPSINLLQPNPVLHRNPSIVANMSLTWQ